MDADSRLKLDLLRVCQFQPGSWEKRFVHDVAALGPYDLLSLRQQHKVDVLYWRYRRQVNALRDANRSGGYPVPLEPEIDFSMRDTDDSDYEQRRPKVEKLDKEAANALYKLAAWNRKAKGK